MSAETIEAIPVGGTLGVELLGAYLLKDLDNESVDAIHQALLEHNAIFFRNQNITPDPINVSARPRYQARIHLSVPMGLLISGDVE